MACGTPWMPFCLTSLEIVASDRALLRALGNTKADSRLVWTSRKISQARDDNGTRCSLPVFVRAAGMIHVRFFRSTFSQVINRASPLRVAVKIKNSKHRMVDGCAWLARTVSMAVRTSSWGMAFEGVGFGERHRDRLHRIVSTIPLRHGPRQDRPTAPLDLFGRFVSGGPNRDLSHERDNKRKYSWLSACHPWSCRARPIGDGPPCGQSRGGLPLRVSRCARAEASGGRGFVGTCGGFCARASRSMDKSLVLKQRDLVVRGRNPAKTFPCCFS